MDLKTRWSSPHRTHSNGIVSVKRLIPHDVSILMQITIARSVANGRGILETCDDADSSTLFFLAAMHLIWHMN